MVFLESRFNNKNITYATFFSVIKENPKILIALGGYIDIIYVILEE
jgi:hypothetical protein